MAFTSGHALVVGIGTYQHLPRWNVPITVKDAEAVAAVLRDPQRAGYPEAQVKLLSDGTATRDGVLAELARLAETLGEQDTLAVFYCGHGAYSEDGTYHLSTHDTKLTGSGKIVAGTAVSQQELIGQLRDVKAKRVLLLLNACHVGAVSPALGDEGLAGQPVPASMSSALLSTGTGRIIITACKEDQLSYIGNKPLTRFTGALVDGLSGRGDVSNRNGYISAYDLYLQTYVVVHELATRNNQEQEPELTVLKGVGPFAVSLYRGASALGSFDESAAPPADGAVREVRPERSLAAMTIIMGNQATAGRDAAGRDQIQAGRDMIQGDKINARGSQGFISRPSGPVSQVFGEQRNIDTGGEYTEGDVDKRQGAFVSGGTVYGPVTGKNDGTITTNYGDQNTSTDGRRITVNQGDYTEGSKVVHGDQVYGNKTGGDSISVGNISNAQGIAIGPHASATVTNSTIGAAKIDAQELRAALESLWQALGQAGLPPGQQITTQTAVGNAIGAVTDDNVDAGSVAANVKKIGDTLTNANTAIEQGSTLWNSIQKLAPLLGPLVGGARVVAAWFGISL